MKILITGGSHVVALNQGLKGLQQSGEIPESLELRVRPLGGGLSVSRKFFRVNDDHIEITDQKFRRKFKQIPPRGVNYDVIAVSTALYSRPLWNKSDWAVYGTPDFSADRIPVSTSLLRRSILDDNKYIISFSEQLRDFGMSVLIVESPRPFRHNPEVKRTGTDLVKYLDNQYRLLTHGHLKESKIPVISVPQTAVDDDGFPDGRSGCRLPVPPGRDGSHQLRRTAAAPMVGRRSRLLVLRRLPQAVRVGIRPLATLPRAAG